MRYRMRMFVLVYVLVFAGMMLFWWGPSKLHYGMYSTLQQGHSLRTVSIVRDVQAAGVAIDDPAYGYDNYTSNFWNHSTAFCDGRFIGYSRLLAILRNVVLDFKFARGQKGGENISDVINQPEEEEFYKYLPGFFKLPCKEPIEYNFIGDSHHLNSWIENALETDGKVFSREAGIYIDWTIAITRYEYANLYHTMTDYYNAFLMLKMFRLNSKDVTILIIDGHPSGGLDATWRYLFGKVKRVSDFRKPTLFKNMIWSMAGYESPLDDHFLPNVPYIEEFREFFLFHYDVSSSYKLNCKRLNILLIWRHDYLAHPRNPSGKVSRKINNEFELLSKMQETFRTHNVRGIQIDKYPMKKQLQMIAKTDILIGMHGAGLSHTLFLPKHSGLLEMFSMYYTAENRHFRAMAGWRGLHYRNWENMDYEREVMEESTNVDEAEVARLTVEISEQMCPKSS
ncbi:uncharacterized protein LOC128209868 [Mya arenaria]|uniref:uncharacterized protein LOC128209774 n=1 Tax=Mya arenaria TaxID=6604 RepID=UPI0022DFB19E|nr:uncharacterized protein LOC128209774 [Mya arenaria]XP_052770085.1 uncharacterized protein LOC128209868 [Mya arenaria]